MDKNGKYGDQWDVLDEDPNIEGAHDTNQRMTKYLAYLMEQRLIIDPTNTIPAISEEFSHTISTQNYASEFFKMGAGKFRRMSDPGKSSFRWPDWDHSDWKRTALLWGNGSSSYLPAETVDSKNKM